jgi:hypothetical protein
MKHIKVTDCDHCPYKSWTITIRCHQCDKLNSQVVVKDHKSLPDNCPLDDYEEQEEDDSVTEDDYISQNPIERVTE